MNRDPIFGVDGYQPQRLPVVTTTPIRYGDRVTSAYQTGTSALPSVAAMDGQHEPTPGSIQPVADMSGCLRHITPSRRAARSSRMRREGVTTDKEQLMPPKINKKRLSALIAKAVDTEGVARMQRVADACNAGIDTDGYKVSTEGDKPLSKHSYRATVITADAEAMRDNLRHNTLIHNLYLAGGN